MMKKQLVVIGNGMAAMRALETLFRHQQQESYQITVFGEEPHENYNRIMLSPVLAGEAQFEEIILNSREWYKQHNIRLFTQDPVVCINREHRTVSSLSGRLQHYDLLIIATGSRPAHLGLPGEEMQGVTGFRTLADVKKMQDYASKGGHAVVVGGGLLGLEAAAGLAGQGMHTTVLHRSGWLLNRQLDQSSAGLLQHKLAQRGIHFQLQRQIEKIQGRYPHLSQTAKANAQEALAIDSRLHVSGLRLDDGQHLPCDLLVIAAGITPEIRIAKASGLNCERGIIVNDQLQSSDPSIYAIGECSQHRGLCYGLVAPIWEQAEVLGKHLAQLEQLPPSTSTSSSYSSTPPSYKGTQTATRLKISGIDLFSAGEINPAPNSGAETLLLQDLKRQVYRKLILRNNRLIGVVFYGDVSDGNWYFKLLQAGRDLSPIRTSLIFGEALNKQKVDQLQLLQPEQPQVSLTTEAA